MKHAFLVMAHTNWDLLKRMLQRIDFADSNIYLHIDAKSEISEEQLKQIGSVCKAAAFHLVPRIEVNWGGYSQIACELSLLKAALRDDNDYYHFLSGIDYPLVTEKEFKAFFDENAGKEFIGFSENGFVDHESHRFQVYHFFQEKVGRTKSPLYYLEKVLVKLQMKSGIVRRTRKYKDVRFELGSNWCSLTKEFVRYLLEKEDQIKTMFRYSCCCDEVFVQTIFANSPFRDNNYQRVSCEGENTQNMRSIDWKRGDPYTFEASDYDELVQSGNLFVRKVNNDTPERAKLLDLLDKKLKNI